MISNINWNHLYSFYLVAKNQSLKKGALEQGVSSSTLSEQLKVLEATLAVQLFSRSKKGLTLTAEGQQLFDRIGQSFETGHKALEKYSKNPLGGYSVQVGIEEALSYQVSAEFLSQYWDLYAPYGIVNTQRQIDHHLLIENLILGKIDWGISLHSPKRKNIDWAPIGNFAVNFYCASELYDRFIEVDSLLENIPLAMSYWDKALNQRVLQHLRSQGIRPKEQVQSDHVDFVKKLCQRGRCIMFASTPPQEYQQGWASGLKSFSIGEDITIPLYALWRKTDEGMLFNQLLKKLIDWQMNRVPARYQDINLQIEISEIGNNLLR